MKRRRITIIASALLLMLAPMAQAQDPIQLPLPWKQGLKVRYHSSAIDERLSAGKTERVETRETTLLEIPEAGAQGFLQVWRSQSPSVKVTGDAESVAAKRALSEALLKRFSGIDMKVELDPQGAYVGIRNWQELGGAMREVLLPVMLRQARVRRELAGADEATLRGKLVPALDRMTGQQAVNSGMGKQAAIYNFFTAASLTPGKKVSYEDSMPSPMSADVIPSVGSFELTSLDEKEGTATIVWKQGIDPVKGAAVAWKLAGELSGNPGLAKAAGLPKALSLSDEATVVVDRKTGLLLSLVHRREVRAGGNSSISTWTLRKRDDD